MARRNKNNPNRGREGGSSRPPVPLIRDVKIGVEDDDKIGVAVIMDTGHTIIAPDEARTLSKTVDDPVIARAIRDRAREVEDLSSREGKTIVAPKLTGEEALSSWVERHHKYIQSCYREAVKTMWSADSVVWVNPLTESLDDVPKGVVIRSPRESQTLISQNFPALRGTFVASPRPGYFYTIACSVVDGRFKGAYPGMLQIPSDSEELPTVAMVRKPSPTDN
jgi:hypothetical protein